MQERIFIVRFCNLSIHPLFIYNFIDIVSNIKQIILLLALLLSISSYAQRLNSLGEKTVSSLHLIEDISSNKQDIKIYYTYDRNNRLLSETYYSIFYTKRVKEVRTRVGNEIKTKSFENGKSVAGYSSGFHLNDSGLIDKYYEGDGRSPNRPYSSRVNDTNVNPNLFFYMPNVWHIYLSGEESEFATEWVGMKSKHIMRSSKYFTVESKIDSCGNI